MSIHMSASIDLADLLAIEPTTNTISTAAPHRWQLVIDPERRVYFYGTADDARNAAVAHKHVRSQANHMHRHVLRFLFQKHGQVLDIGRREQHFRGAADPEPGHAAKIGHHVVPPADAGETFGQIRADAPRSHHA